MTTAASRIPAPQPAGDSSPSNNGARALGFGDQGGYTGIVRHKGGPRPRPAQERFWEKVDVRGPDECWEWKAGRNRPGYGRFYVTVHKNTAAHRFSYIWAHGPIPDGLCVCHRCDNPGCVNPAHLWLGTHQDNMSDCVRKQRQNHVRAAGLTEREQQVFDLTLAGLGMKETAARLDMFPGTVKTHRRYILKKLGARDCAELMARRIAELEAEIARINGDAP